MAHTPGPWTARQCDGQILLNGSNCYEVREIINPQGGFNPEDIRLMAAAPELLLRCRQLLDWTRPEYQSEVNEDYLGPIWRAAAAAIAKAEGRGE